MDKIVAFLLVVSTSILHQFFNTTSYTKTFNCCKNERWKVIQILTVASNCSTSQKPASQRDIEWNKLNQFPAPPNGVQVIKIILANCNSKRADKERQLTEPHSNDDSTVKFDVWLILRTLFRSTKICLISRSSSLFSAIVCSSVVQHKHTKTKEIFSVPEIGKI